MNIYIQFLYHNNLIDIFFAFVRNSLTCPSIVQCYTTASFDLRNSNTVSICYMWIYGSRFTLTPDVLSGTVALVCL